MDERRPLTIRDAIEGDLPAINEIYNHYVRTCTCTWQIEPDTADERQAWFVAHDARHPVIVAEIDCQVVGWGSLSPLRSRAGHKITVEDSLYVRPGFHGRGIGGTMLRELIARAQAAGHHTIIAVISADQAPSISLHAKHGFVEAGRLLETGLKFDRRLDVVYMQKML